jgi:hypothetical protein
MNRLYSSTVTERVNCVKGAVESLLNYLVFSFKVEIVFLASDITDIEY